MNSVRLFLFRLAVTVLFCFVIGALWLIATLAYKRLVEVPTAAIIRRLAQLWGFSHA